MHTKKEALRLLAAQVQKWLQKLVGSRDLSSDKLVKITLEAPQSFLAGSRNAPLSYKLLRLSLNVLDKLNCIEQKRQPLL